MSSGDLSYVLSVIEMLPLRITEYLHLLAENRVAEVMSDVEAHGTVIDKMFEQAINGLDSIMFKNVRADMVELRQLFGKLQGNLKDELRKGSGSFGDVFNGLSFMLNRLRMNCSTLSIMRDNTTIAAESRQFAMPSEQPQATRLPPSMATVAAMAAPLASQSPRRAEGRVSDAQFLAVTKKKAFSGKYCAIDIYAYTDAYESTILNDIKNEYGLNGLLMKKSGSLSLKHNMKLEVQLYSEDLDLYEDAQYIIWNSRYGKVSYNIKIPKDFLGDEICFMARIRADGVQLCRLTFTVNVARRERQHPPVDVHYNRKAFVSYASEDRAKVLARIQGMQKIAPRMEFFMDVLSLRSGDNWEKRLWEEIPASDIFYLFWSRNALMSKWVEKEWHCAFKERGSGFIEPVPLESPQVAPPPVELVDRHFNDWTLLYDTAGERQ